MPMSETAQGKQAVPEFDEAAFERAFEQAHQDALETAQSEQHAVENHAQQMRQLEKQDAERVMAAESDPVLLRIRDTRPGRS